MVYNGYSGYFEFDSSNIFKRSWDGGNKVLAKLWNIPQVIGFIGNGIVPWLGMKGASSKVSFTSKTV